MTLSRKPWFLFAIAVFAIAAVALSACGSDSKSSTTPSVGDGGPEYNGAIPTDNNGKPKPIQKPDVVINDTSGKPFDLRKETDGTFTLFFIGYTHCPDICPTHMADIAATLKGMDPDAAAKVKVVFVTSDPARDTPEVLRKWLDSFNSSYIGLVPTEEQLNKLTTAIGMGPVTKTDIGNGDYAVNHAAYVMAYTSDNLAHIVYPGGVTREMWAHDIPLLATEGWKGA